MGLIFSRLVDKEFGIFRLNDVKIGIFGEFGKAAGWRDKSRGYRAVFNNEMAWWREGAMNREGHLLQDCKVIFINPKLNFTCEP